MTQTKKQAPGKWFSEKLLTWNSSQNNRQMPWKGEKDPYKIWLSEIILQQTRVEQGREYYNRFVKAFPVIQKLAKAPDEKVFKFWEGLGYYSRCRNLLATARFISTELKGAFPSDYDSIKSLKGVGPYTAAAIASFAYNLPHAVVDGNVFRVLARVFGISTAVDSAAGKKQFTALADELLDKQQPGRYNQAIMDFGAIVCRPVSPQCNTCVFNSRCVAYKEQKTEVLPVKEKKITIKKRWFYYLVMEYKNKAAIRQRSTKDIWQGLYEFPLIETVKETSVQTCLKLAEKNGWLVKGGYETTTSVLYKQQLSHQLITGQFIIVRLKKKPLSINGWQWAEKNKLDKLAFPRFIRYFLKDKK